MNKILAGILKVVEVGAVSVVPGAGPVDAAIHNIVDNHGDKEVAVEQAVLAAFEELEQLKPDMVNDKATFNANAVIAHDAIIRMIAAVKKPVDSTHGNSTATAADTSTK